MQIASYMHAVFLATTFAMIGAPQMISNKFIIHVIYSLGVVIIISQSCMYNHPKGVIYLLPAAILLIINHLGIDHCIQFRLMA